MAVLSTRWSSFSIMMDAVPAAMLFGEISTQSHVRPRISTIHILHAKDGLIASFRWASSQISSARKCLGIPDFTFKSFTFQIEYVLFWRKFAGNFFKKFWMIFRVDIELVQKEVCIFESVIWRACSRVIYSHTAILPTLKPALRRFRGSLRLRARFQGRTA